MKDKQFGGQNNWENEGTYEGGSIYGIGRLNDKLKNFFNRDTWSEILCENFSDIIFN